MSKRDHVSPRRTLPRTRGATSGLLLLLLGIWGALICFVGPYFNFSFTPDKAWTWSAARGWLEVLPGAVTFAGGLMLLASRSRLTTLVGAWFGVAGGAWFVIGPALASWLHLGSPGTPAGSGTTVRTLESLALFSLLGAVILFLAASAFGRLSVVSLRDVHAAERQEQQLADQRAADEAIRDRRIAEARRAERHGSNQQPSDSRGSENDENDKNDENGKPGLADRLHLHHRDNQSSAEEEAPSSPTRPGRATPENRDGGGATVFDQRR